MVFVDGLIYINEFVYDTETYESKEKLTCYNSDFELEWENEYICKDIKVVNDEIYIITSEYKDYLLFSKFKNNLLKLDNKGEIVWETELEDNINNYVFMPANDNNITVVGKNIIQNFDSEGVLQSEIEFKDIEELYYLYKLDDKYFLALTEVFDDEKEDYVYYYYGYGVSGKKVWEYFSEYNTILDYKVISNIKDNVNEFIKLLNKSEYTEEYSNYYDYFGSWYNITSENVLENSEAKVFKRYKKADSYLQYNNKIYKLGEENNGCGLTDTEICDVNGDGIDELYFTYSYIDKDEVYAGHIGYFDFASEELVYLDYAVEDCDLMLIKDAIGEITIYVAQIEWADGYYMSWALYPEYPVAGFVFDDEHIKLEEKNE